MTNTFVKLYHNQNGLSAHICYWRLWNDTLNEYMVYGSYFGVFWVFNLGIFRFCWWRCWLLKVGVVGRGDWWIESLILWVKDEEGRWKKMKIVTVHFFFVLLLFFQTLMFCCSFCCRVFLYKGFLSDKECDYLIALVCCSLIGLDFMYFFFSLIIIKVSSYISTIESFIEIQYKCKLVLYCHLIEVLHFSISYYHF